MCYHRLNGGGLTAGVRMGESKRTLYMQIGELKVKLERCQHNYYELLDAFDQQCERIEELEDKLKGAKK